jgi:Na+/melibiose symporter-like transporter
VGIVTGGAMLYTVVLTLTISSTVGFGTANKSAICMGIYIGLSLIGCFLYCFVKINLKRRDHEQKILEQRNSGDSGDY